MKRIDAQALLRQVDLAELIGRTVDLRRSGREWLGRCPFHDERTPSFTVSEKGFYHCFGCGEHGDAITWLMRTRGLDFRAACAELGGSEPATAAQRIEPAPARTRTSEWLPITPVPLDAPPLVDAHGRATVWNPKRGRVSVLRPTLTHEYRNSEGRPLGYVLRADFADRATGKRIKITPQVAWCVDRGGATRWCITPFATPRPIYGLDALAAKPTAPVIW